MRLIKSDDSKSAGFLNKYLESRLIKNNKNVLIAITGQTGSGKSYVSLRIAELWYDYHFKKAFPIENCCFSIDTLVKRLSSGELKRGDILILEEGGVNLGSLDFQNKVSKLFTYVLQSFRSMNVGLIINLPVLTMLNKSARLLLHANFITNGINKIKNRCIIKPLFHQLNQQSGKIYAKYPIGKIKGDVRQIKRFYYGLPSEELINEYEVMKGRFVHGFLDDFNTKIEQKKAVEEKKGRLNPKSLQPDVWEIVQKYPCKTQKDIIKYMLEVKGRKVDGGQLSRNLRVMRKKGYNIDDFLVN